MERRIKLKDIPLIEEILVGGMVYGTFFSLPILLVSIGIIILSAAKGW